MFHTTILPKKITLAVKYTVQIKSLQEKIFKIGIFLINIVHLDQMLTLILNI